MNKDKIEKPTLVEPQAGSMTVTKTKAKVRAKLSVKPKVRKNPPIKAKDASLSIQIPSAPISQQIFEEAPKIEGYALKAEQSALISTEELESLKRSQLTAQELLDKPLEELEKDLGKRDARNLLKNMKIITAIMLGKNKNKELSQVLNTDKSFTSKQIKQLEDQGLVTRAGEGKETKYEVDRFNVMKFLESKVIIKWGTRSKQSLDGPSETKNTNGFARESKNVDAQKDKADKVS